MNPPGWENFGVKLTDLNPIERVTGGRSVIDTDHKAIHDSIRFKVFKKFTLNSNATAYISLKTPADRFIHYRKEKVSTSADKVDIELFENAVIADGTGTVFIPVNHDRITPKFSMVTVKIDPTVTNEGTKIDESFIGGGTGTGSARTGSETAQDEEIVLNKNTTYLVKITNGSSTQNIVQVKPSWYEESY